MYVIVFSAILFFVVGLAAWAAVDRYYEANLEPVAEFDGVAIPTRDYSKELRFQLVKFYVDYGVPPGFENDSRIAAQKADYERVALERVLEYALLDSASRAEGIAVSQEQVDERYAKELSQFRSRHVLVTPDAKATDKDAADKAALDEAKAVVEQLRANPNDQELWKRVAKEKSDDPGSAESGGELGWVGRGQFVKDFEDAALALATGAISDPVKSQFGYHVIQVQERRGPEENDLVKRWLASGFSVQDIKDHVRYDTIRDEITTRRRKEAVVSPVPQIRVAQIVINTPTPTATNFDQFTAGLKKLADVQEALEKGTDFAEVAKQFSDDALTAEKGGEIGWIARGMLEDVRAEDDLFRFEVGSRTRPYSQRTASTIYKVLEKDPSRAVTDDQKKTLEERAYPHWYQTQLRAHGARRLIPGLES